MGVLIVNVTIAPATGVRFWVTVAVKLAVLLFVYDVELADKVAVSCGGFITVTFALLVPEYDKFDAVAVTANVPTGVPVGGVIARVIVPLCPGARVSEPGENEAAQPVGCEDDGTNVVEEHAEESLF